MGLAVTGILSQTFTRLEQPSRVSFCLVQRSEMLGADLSTGFNARVDGIGSDFASDEDKRGLSYVEV